METILFIAIAVIISIIQNRAEKAKKNAPQKPPLWGRRGSSSSDVEEGDDRENSSDESVPPQEPAFSPSRKLQEYIKQFEEAQREASQGTLEPAMPPPIPEEKTHTHNVGNNVTLREVAEDVILMDSIDVEYLMDEFELSEGTAISILSELQKHRIVGHDMGNGECDVLVHDEIELNNLLSRELNEETEAGPKAETQVPASDKQNQMKILEERARQAREEANRDARQNDIENGYADAATDEAEPKQRQVVRSISKESVRRGFIWGKIIDEPRFKRRWTPAHR